MREKFLAASGQWHHVCRAQDLHLVGFINAEGLSEPEELAEAKPMRSLKLVATDRPWAHVLGHGDVESAPGPCGHPADGRQSGVCLHPGSGKFVFTCTQCELKQNRHVSLNKEESIAGRQTGFILLVSQAKPFVVSPKVSSSSVLLL